jgi:hypothetical protein
LDLINSSKKLWGGFNKMKKLWGVIVASFVMENTDVWGSELLADASSQCQEFMKSLDQSSQDIIDKRFNFLETLKTYQPGEILDFVRNHREKDLHPLGYVFISTTPSIPMTEQFQAVEMLEELGEEYKEPIVNAYFMIATTPKTGLLNGLFNLQAAKKLSKSGLSYQNLAIQAYQSIAMD